MAVEETQEEIEARERLIEVIMEQTRAGEENIDAAVKEWQQRTKQGKAFVEARKATKTFTGGLKDSAKALGTSTGNFNDLSAVVTGTINAVSGLLGKIPVLGSTFEALGDAAGETIGFAIGQVQSGFDSFQELSRAGLTAGDGISGVATRMREANIPLATYTRLLAENSETLAYFSASAIDGGKQFSKIMTNMAGETGKPLRRLGFSVQEIGETVIDYQKMQRLMGIRQSLTMDQLQKKSMDYAKELDAVAKLTGLNRKDLQKQREEQLSDARFRAGLNQIAAENGETQANAINNFVAALKQQSPEIAKGAQDILMGYANTEAARKLYTSGLADTMTQQLDMLKAGRTETGEALNAMAARAKEMSQVGGYQQEAAKVFESGMAPFVNYAELAKLANFELKDLTSVTKEQATAAAAAGSQTDKLVTSMMEMQEATSAINAFFINTKAATETIDMFSTTMLKTITYIEDAFMENKTAGGIAYDINPLKKPGEWLGKKMFDWFGSSSVDRGQKENEARKRAMAAAGAPRMAPELAGGSMPAVAPLTQQQVINTQRKAPAAPSERAQSFQNAQGPTGGQANMPATREDIHKLVTVQEFGNEQLRKLLSGQSKQTKVIQGK